MSKYVEVSIENRNGALVEKSLLECPFCGGEPEVERQGTNRQSCIIICTDCGCRHESSDEFEFTGHSWNTRV